MPFSQDISILEYYILYCLYKKIDINNLISAENIDDVFDLQVKLVNNNFLKYQDDGIKMVITNSGKDRLKYLAKRNNLKGSEKFILPLNNFRIDKMSIDDIYLK